MDEFGLFVTDFYDALNETSEITCYQEFGLFDLENIQKLRTLIGRRFYAVPYIFGAVDLEYLNHDFEFVFRFLSQYFRLRENSSDYLWIDDTDWCYSAEEMIWLSARPYTPEWTYKKLTRS